MPLAVKVLLKIVTCRQCRTKAEQRLREPDVIVVDPEVSDGGVKLVRQLAQTHRECGVLVLARSARTIPVGPALQGGARGYLEKDCEPEALIEAIERVHAGELVITSALMEAVVQELASRRGLRSRGMTLTVREIEVLQLVARGCSNQEIGRELVITEHTVKAHLAKIREKLGLESRVQLALYAA